MEKKEFICINCPQGCHLTVTIDHGQVSCVEGNQCKRGEEYGRQEAIEPLRVLTGLMRVSGQTRPLSIRTTKPIPKKLLADCVNLIRRYEAKPPVGIGDVMISDICGTGADIVATAKIPEV